MSTDVVLPIEKGIAVTACACALGAGVAVADWSDIALEVTATNDTHTSTFTIRMEWGSWSGGNEEGEQSWHRELPETYEFEHGLGSITVLDLTLCEDPEINLNFAVQAGSQDTEFHLASQELTFDPIDPAEAHKSP